MGITSITARNKYICEIAEQILLVGVDEKSSLYPLIETYKNKQLNGLTDEEIRIVEGGKNRRCLRTNGRGKNKKVVQKFGTVKKM